MVILKVHTIYGTVLGEACMTNQIEVIKFYMNLKGNRRVDFNKHCSSGDSLFHEACRSRNVQVVKMFLDRAEELDIELNIRDGRGDTPPIMYACKSKDVMQLLLSDARIDAKATDDEGHNVLHHICHMGIDRPIVFGGVQINKPNPQEEDHVTDITILLLQSSKVPYIKDTSRGMSPLHHACDNHDKGLRIKAILEFIMERESIDVNEEDDAGRTAAHVAFGSAFRYELEDLAPQLEDLNSKILPPTLSIILEYAKKMGINLEATDNDGRTPLHHLCRSPLRRELSRRSASDPKARIETFLEVAKIQYGVEFNLNATDNDGKTPRQLVGIRKANDAKKAIQVLLPKSPLPPTTSTTVNSSASSASAAGSGSVSPSKTIGGFTTTTTTTKNGAFVWTNSTRANFKLSSRIKFASLDRFKNMVNKDVHFILASIKTEDNSNEFSFRLHLKREPAPSQGEQNKGSKKSQQQIEQSYIEYLELEGKAKVPTAQEWSLKVKTEPPVFLVSKGNFLSDYPGARIPKEIADKPFVDYELHIDKCSPMQVAANAGAAPAPTTATPPPTRKWKENSDYI